MKKFFRDGHINRRILAVIMICAFLIPIIPSTTLAAADLPSAPLVEANGDQNGVVRIYLSSLGTVSSLSVTLKGAYTVNGNSNMSITSGSTVTVSFNASTGMISLTWNGSTSSMGTEFRLRRHQISGTNGFTIAQARTSNVYPGDLQFVSRSDGSGYKLYTIAHIYIEDYLYGVLPYEMGNTAHIEALKAQAVTARTYTLRAMTSATSALYDVVDTTSDQVYNGTPSGNDNCKAAVDATKGIVSKNNGAFTGTWYTASNGGQIESVKNIWGSSAYSYIRVKDDPYDLNNPDSRVKSFTVSSGATQTNSTVSSLLNSKAESCFGSGAKVTAVHGIIPHTPKYAEPSRLYTKMDFDVNYSRNGSTGRGTMTFSIFDELEGPLSMSIQSSDNELWSVTKTSTGFLVEARRYGHGTGLSQRGAMYMGKLGYTYDQIMAFYFEGCTRVRYTLTSSILSPIVSGQTSIEVISDEEAAELGKENGCSGIVELTGNDTLPIRKMPSATAEILYRAPSAAEMDVLGASGSYYYVRFGAICGYVLKSGLSISGTVPTSSGTGTELDGWGKTTASVNLRQEANTSSTSLCTVPSGAELPLISVSNGWAYTQYGRLVGYVSMSYVTRISQTGNESYDADDVSADITADCFMYIAKNTESYIIRTLTVGTEVAYLGDDGSWATVRIGRQTGYIDVRQLNRTYHKTDEWADDQPSGLESYARVINTTKLNLRAAASESAEILTEMPLNALLIVVSKGTTFSAVRYHGVCGYAMNSYLTAAVSDEEMEDASLQAVVATESGSLNLRENASTSATILTSIPKDTVIKVLEKSSEWCKVTYNGYVGYVKSEYLSFTAQETTTAKPTSTPTKAPTATPKPTATPEPDPVIADDAQPVARVTASKKMPLHLHPLGDSKVICYVSPRALVTVYEYGINWSLVEADKGRGYIQTKYLDILGGDILLASAETVSVDELSWNDETEWAPQVDSLGVGASGENGDAAETLASENLEQMEVTAAPKSTPKPTEKAKSSKYNDVRDKTLTALSSPITAPITVSWGRLNMRTGCHKKADLIVKIDADQLLTVLERGKEWCLVEYDGQTGYVMTQYLVLPKEE